jgi:lipopolysaccharide biosynthesis regulator YciM
MNDPVIVSLLKALFLLLTISSITGWLLAKRQGQSEETRKCSRT